MGKKEVVVDTDVFVRALRGDQEAMKDIEAIGEKNVFVSVVTLAELLYGVNERNVKSLRSYMNRYRLMHIDNETSKRFINLMAGQTRPKIDFADVMIAATSLVINREIFTYNRRHFSRINGVKLYDKDANHGKPKGRKRPG